MCGDEGCHGAEVRQIEHELERAERAARGGRVAGGAAHAGSLRGAPTRRAVLGGVAAAVSAPVVLTGGRAGAATVSAVTGQRSFSAAMHMHASFSEQQGSWQGQAWRMQQEGVDLLFMTDHSHGLLASGMADDLTGCVIASRSSGSLRQQRATVASGRARVVAESAGSATASSVVVTDPDAKANGLALRTSVMGQVLHLALGSVSVDGPGVFEVRVGLSHHPRTNRRPQGLYGLCFRFGPGLPPQTFLEDGGLTAVVTAPAPASGTTLDLDLTAACAAAWPDLLPEDNGTQWVSLGAVSPRSGVVVDVDTTLQFRRETRTAASVGAVQQEMATRYAADYGLSIVPAVELGSRSHHNAFTPTQYFSSDEGQADTNPAAYTRANVAGIHAAGGVVSWNHPFGSNVGTPLTGATATRRRQAVYTQLARQDVYGVDILEVGYGVRGDMTIDEHLNLWDTFSRHARFLTGNGVSDSHDSARDRRTSGNEFVTGVWASSTGMGAILPALGTGRAYTRHVSAWPGGELDLLVDGVHPMGSVVLRSGTSRRLTITATALPAGAVVEVVAGAVDYAGIDPGTTVVATLPESSFRSSGVATYDLSVPGSCFVRLTVRLASGVVVGVSNPVWLLTSPPPGGVPTGRLSP